MISQLRKDISRRCDEKLQQWVSDSINLYEMAGLSTRAAYVDILTSLSSLTVHAAVHAGVDPDEFGQVMKDSAHKLRSILREHGQLEDEQ